MDQREEGALLELVNQIKASVDKVETKVDKVNDTLNSRSIILLLALLGSAVSIIAALIAN